MERGNFPGLRTGLFETNSTLSLFQQANQQEDLLSDLAHCEGKLMVNGLQPAEDGGSIPAPSLHSLDVRLIPDKEGDALVKEHHYLHRARVGRRISYGIFSPELEGVIVYAYPMTSAPIQGVPSDEVLEFARLFLFRNVKNMASKFISLTLRRVAADWTHKYPSAKRPRLVVSWSDTAVHTGTVYKAANFTSLGVNRPRARGPNRNKAFTGSRKMREDHWHPKHRWVRPL